MATKLKPTVSGKIRKGTPARPVRDRQADEIARDLDLMDEFEVLVQSLPDYRAQAGLAPLPENAIALVYDEREAQLL